MCDRWWDEWRWSKVLRAHARGTYRRRSAPPPPVLPPPDLPPPGFPPGLPPGLFPGPRRGPSFGPSSKRRDLLPGPLLRGPERVSRSDAPKRPSPRGPPGFPVLRPSKLPLPCSTVRPSASRNSARSRLPGRRSLRPSSRCSRRSGRPSSERLPSGRGRCGRASLSKRPSGRLL